MFWVLPHIPLVSAYTPFLEYAETYSLSTRLLEKSSTDNATIVLEPGYGVRSP